MLFYQKETEALGKSLHIYTCDEIYTPKRILHMHGQLIPKVGQLSPCIGEVRFNKIAKGRSSPVALYKSPKVNSSRVSASFRNFAPPKETRLCWTYL
jgi:hypothetical protein